MYNDRYWNGFNQNGVCDSLTKKPESSMNGIRSTGIIVTASFFSEKATDKIIVYAELAK